jgi:hypothetical protein
MCIEPAAVDGPGAAPAPHAAGHHHLAAADAGLTEQPAPAHHATREAAHDTGDRRAGRLRGEDCCPRPTRPRAWLTASRAATLLVLKSHAAILAPAAVLGVLERETAGPSHGRPPGGLSPVRSSAILRI